MMKYIEYIRSDLGKRRIAKFLAAFGSLSMLHCLGFIINIDRSFLPLIDAHFISNILFAFALVMGLALFLMNIGSKAVKSAFVFLCGLFWNSLISKRISKKKTGDQPATFHEVYRYEKRLVRMLSRKKIFRAIGALIRIIFFLLPISYFYISIENVLLLFWVIFMAWMIGSMKYRFPKFRVEKRVESGVSASHGAESTVMALIRYLRSPTFDSGPLVIAVMVVCFLSGNFRFVYLTSAKPVVFENTNETEIELNIIGTTRNGQLFFKGDTRSFHYHLFESGYNLKIN